MGLDLLHIGKEKGVRMFLGRAMDGRRCRYLGQGENFIVGV